MPPPTSPGGGHDSPGDHRRTIDRVADGEAHAEKVVAAALCRCPDSPVRRGGAANRTGGVQSAWEVTLFSADLKRPPFQRFCRQSACRFWRRRTLHRRRAGPEARPTSNSREPARSRHSRPSCAVNWNRNGGDRRRSCARSGSPRGASPVGLLRALSSGWATPGRMNWAAWIAQSREDRVPRAAYPRAGPSVLFVWKNMSHGAQR